MSATELTQGLNFLQGAFAQDTVSSAQTAADAAPPYMRLVARARAGDAQAFGALYESFGAMVHGILLARVPTDEVEDLVQDVFLLAFRKLDSLREDAAFGGWLAMIARNRATDFHRRKPPTDELEENAFTGTPEDADRQANEIMRVIRALPDAYRETLTLRLVEGMTGAEIAEQTGLTPASVRVNLHRGMKMLRSALTEKGVL